MVCAARVVSAAPKTAGVARQALTVVEAANPARAHAQCALVAPPSLPTAYFPVAQAACRVPPARQPATQAIAVHPQLPASKMGPGVQ